jgi:hypothetical protein
LGGDICLNSLRLTNGCRERYRIANAAFLQMNLFDTLPGRQHRRPGVLHHTGDARKGLKTLLGKVKSGGHILIRLYNSYGRLPTLWRRWAFERFGPALYFLDSRLTSARMNEGRWQAWFSNQYRHPHETRHSIDEVLGWFDAAGSTFCHLFRQLTEFPSQMTLDCSRRIHGPPGQAGGQLSCRCS